MEGMTVRGYFEDGEVTFAGPIDVDGCWRVEVTFVEREDAHFEVSPHAPESLLGSERMEELHRQMESQKPQIGPY